MDEVHHALVLFLRLWRYTVGSVGWGGEEVRRVRRVRGWGVRRWESEGVRRVRRVIQL